MGYCETCNAWVGYYSTADCNIEECVMTRKLIGLYGIKRIEECLTKIFVRDDKAIENSTENIDKIDKICPKEYALRSIKNKGN